ncbi:hypothetical protein ADK55_18570 [Streptomyces sp. WM4235]|uniref:hypothetical protein n=1 Tax=Streptomyces sp. WM4235 TaxID=1415551 RepID=UPI0006AFDD16|nr:hypothetical protein [Streptomyces sp. WM4235]KOU50548.1 hypothetical protein ADK55_18570 [Streptomyces sp. WM4235]
MTPSEELRAAETLLRSLLEHAAEGPWWGDDLDEVQSSAGQIGRALGTGADGKYPYPNSRYMAAMHPGVGTALADLLERQGKQAEEIEQYLGAQFQDGALDQDIHDALAVARAILGTRP